MSILIPPESVITANLIVPCGAVLDCKLFGLGCALDRGHDGLHQVILQWQEPAGD